MSQEKPRHPNEYGGANCTTLSISTYLAQRKHNPDTVEVVVNDEVVPRDLWDEYNIRDEDKVRVIRNS